MHLVSIITIIELYCPGVFAVTDNACNAPEVISWLNNAMIGR
jgi:hypothetical protein